MRRREGQAQEKGKEWDRERVPDEVVVYRFRSVVLFNGLGGQTNE